MVLNLKIVSRMMCEGRSGEFGENDKHTIHNKSTEIGHNQNKYSLHLWGDIKSFIPPTGII